MTKCYKFSKYTKRVYIGQENKGIGMWVSSDGDTPEFNTWHGILEGCWKDGKLNGFGRHTTFVELNIDLSNIIFWK